MFDLNADDTANAIYLVIMLAFLVSGVLLNKRMKISEFLKSLFLWTIIILFLVLLYSFRYDFYKIKDRILGELDPSRPVKTSSESISINISSDHHFYIDLKVNGKPIKFMIDTGASNMVLSVDDAKKAGIDVKNLKYNQIHQTANGKTFGASAILEEVAVNDEIKIKNVPVSVNSGEMSNSLLGMRFLRDNFLRYEFYQDRLVLYTK